VKGCIYNKWKRRARQLEGKEPNICIKKMHAHMRGSELEEEEELRKHEEALKKREEEHVVRERELEKQMEKSHTQL
jgi:hypothetical protein